MEYKQFLVVLTLVTYSRSFPYEKRAMSSLFECLKLTYLAQDVRDAGVDLLDHVPLFGPDLDGKKLVAKMSHEFLGFDVFDNDQLRSVACQALDATNIGDFISTLGPALQDFPVKMLAAYYNHMREGRDMLLHQYNYDLPLMDAAREWMKTTNFPYFPLPLTEHDILITLELLPKDSRDKLGFNPEISNKDLTKVLAESTSFDMFAQRSNSTAEQFYEPLHNINAVDQYKYLYGSILRLMTAAINAGLADLPFTTAHFNPDAHKQDHYDKSEAHKENYKYSNETPKQD